MIGYFLLGAVPIAAVSGIYAYQYRPEMFLKAFIRYQFFRRKFKVRKITTPTRTFCYAHRPSSSPRDGRPALLLLHGFSASKDMWLWVLNFLPTDIEVIALDLPGHGETTTFPSDDIGIEAQADAVHDFVTYTGFDKLSLHVCGPSMGGTIAGTFASKYPNSVSLATLICPAMKTPRPSRFQHAILNGGKIEDWLLPQNTEQVQNMLNAVTLKSKKLSPKMLQAILNLRLPKNDFYRRLWAKMLETMEMQEELLEKFGKVQVPGQLIWGADDAIVDPSGVEILLGNNPNVRVDIVESAGHSVAMERPRKLANLIVEFQNQVMASNKVA